MIATLRGNLLRKESNRIIVEVSGVGYSCDVSTQTFSRLPEAGKEVFLEVHHHITESDQRLFAFSSADEMRTFELLITVKGIGPRIALNILSGIDTDTLVGAIRSGRSQTLASLPGIGKKTAERMIIELRDAMGLVGTAKTEPTGGSQQGATDLQTEAVNALVALGYKTSHAERTVAETLSILLKEGESPTVSTLIKKSLSTLSKG